MHLTKSSYSSRFATSSYRNFRTLDVLTFKQCVTYLDDL